MLVSCLTITRGRPALLRRAISLFLSQTWEDKEMVVVVDPRGGVEWVSGLEKSPLVKVVVPGSIHQIADLRNLSSRLSQGDVVLTWDDDDLYHPKRIESQVHLLEEKSCDAVYLGDVLHFFEDTGELSAIHWDIGMPATMACRKAALPIYHPPIAGVERGSDSVVYDLLVKQGRVMTLFGSPHLYVRTFHGQNVWPRAHHELLVSRHGAAVDRQAVLPELMKFAPDIAGRIK